MLEERTTPYSAGMPKLFSERAENESQKIERAEDFYRSSSVLQKQRF